MRSLAQTAPVGIDFQSLAAHEMRSPLAAVMIQLELLVDKLEGEDAELARGALRSTQRMGRLVEQLLAVSRLDAAPTHPRREWAPVDLGDVVLDVADELEWMARDHRLSVAADRAIVGGVRDDLHRLFFNLVDNALAHTPAGTEIDVIVAGNGSAATVTVQDNGPGIPAELERHVFERFVRGGDDGSKGSGLGLAIVRELAHKHGGYVALERRPDHRGTTFVVRLPRLPDQPQVRDGGPRLQLLS